ncbi:hypothetical protein B9Z55_021435 [Caenorhabditis nigoni]|nr:hypothetical protein B9Z55_021435 [Caenorhabditis nigoni]
MGHAYQWLSQQEKDNLKGIYVKFDDRKINLTLGHHPDNLKDKIIEKHFAEPFCTDLDLLIENQKKELICLEIMQNSETEISEIRLKILEILEKALISKSVIFLKIDKSINLDFEEILPLVQWNPGGEFEFDLHFLTSENENLDLEEMSLEPENFLETINSRIRNSEIFEKFGNFRLDSILLSSISSDYEDSEDDVDSENSETEILDPKTSTWQDVFRNLVIMGEVLKNLQLFDIQRLRKTCSGARKCIDRIQPNPHISKYSIQLENNFRIFAEISLDSGEYQLIMYKKDSDIEMHSSGIWYKTVEAEILIPRILQDFEVNLMYQKTEIQEFQLDFCYDYEFKTHSLEQFIQKKVEEVRENSAYAVKKSNGLDSFKEEFLENLEKFLRSKTLKTRKINIGCVSQSEILKILPFLNSEVLKAINFHHPYSGTRMKTNNHVILKILENSNLEIDEISKTEQWRNSEELVISGLPIFTNIQSLDFTNFQFLDILVDTVSSDDVFHLKTELSKSSHFQKFKIAFL